MIVARALRGHHVRTALVMAFALAGCTAGPDFHAPAAPDVSRYTAQPLPEKTASAATELGAAQRFRVGQDVATEWWRSLGSARLDALIQQALAANPTLAAARATLRQAQETYAAQAGATRYPQIDASLGAQRQRVNPTAMGLVDEPQALSMFNDDFNLVNAGIGVRYRFDFAGGSRRALEALAARTDYQHRELDATRLALATNVATAAIVRARLAGQIAATQAMISARSEQLELTREGARIGQIPPDDVLSLQAQVETARTALPALRTQLEKTEHLLAILGGQAPGAASVPNFTLAEFKLSAELPVLLPSELVRRRPDIQAAEALLHAATANYGIAVAKLYPQLDLSANLGAQALTMGALFGPGTAVWSAIAQLTQPLFRPGLPAERRAALAAIDAAAANYQAVVLSALREVADALRALNNDAEALAASAAADQAARASVENIRDQHELGAASHVQLLVAQQQADNARTRLIAAQAQRLIDNVALYQALGGGASSQ
ncbi:efflux transporter outer membrane subunit [Castellaniella caeni]|uniref:efflux transporter outer membrane subunit n=1 Tax=Castellaniella caeni TaxID=266123 RepID=UPI0008333787|nr:efflux transporter outer membrane subunit [Castellaniella caeni]